MGNTPTHVGKTRAHGFRHFHEGKHPHARGEDILEIKSASATRETPPRTWGRLPDVPVVSDVPGNTPTHVGKTCARRQPEALLWKHPHARGEDDLGMADSTAIWETPPRTWGRQPTVTMHATMDGNTPTHVGKTHSLSRAGGPCRKHPHARGEDGRKAACMDYGEETPPRTWGRLGEALRRVRLERNTPTHVGKTDPLGVSCQPLQKHPHARGEDELRHINNISNQMAGNQRPPMPPSL